MTLPTLRWSLFGIASLATAAPVLAQPAVVVQPAPEVVQPAPVVVQPAPVVVQPAPEEIVIMGHYGRVPDNVDSASVAISYADLDLSYPGDRKILRQRISLTARYLCDKLGESDTGAGSCRDEATRIIERHKPDGSVVADADWAKRFATEVEMFKRDGGASAQTGTPLKAWPVIDARQAADLAAIQIYTVEDIAGLSDGNLARVGMGARELQAKAKAFLAAAKDTAEVQRLAAENERKDARIGQLEQQLRDLSAKVEAAMAKQEAA